MKIIDMHCDTIHRIWQENDNTNKMLDEKWYDFLLKIIIKNNFKKFLKKF